MFGILLSPCPQGIGDIAIGNATDEVVSVTIQTTGALFVDSTSFQLPANTGAALVSAFFDCSTTTSFNGEITITSTSSQGTETVIVSVAMDIQD